MTGKKILIIGATGTLGSEFTRQLLETDVGSIRAYARNENKMFWYKKQYNNERMRYCLGDIRNKGRLSMACRDIDIIINCAALKHVQLCEDNTEEALWTNIDGVQLAIECAMENDAEQFVQISSDKSVNATNFYGKTKAVAEDLVLNAHNQQGKNRTVFSVYRSGNVKGSSGSVLEVWKQQIEDGKPCTITDVNAVRYMQDKEKIVKAIIDNIIKVNIAKVNNEKVNRGLYVLDMPKLTVLQLLQSEYGVQEYVEVGLRKGEKLIEELYSENEEVTIIKTGGE